MKSGKMVKMGLGAICLAGLLMAAVPAGAASYTLSDPNTALSPYTGPYGSVNVTLDVTHTIATVTFTAAGGFLFGDGGTAGVNVNGAFTAAIVTDPNFSSFQFGNNEDGFGPFDLSIKDTDGYGDALSSVVFTLTKSSGTWLNDSTVLDNIGGYYVAAHIFVIGDGGALQTGFAAGSTQDSHDILPDGGSTVALLGFGLLGIATLRQRLSRK